MATKIISRDQPRSISKSKEIHLGTSGSPKHDRNLCTKTRFGCSRSFSVLIRMNSQIQTRCPNCRLFKFWLPIGLHDRVLLRLAGAPAQSRQHDKYGNVTDMQCKQHPLLCTNCPCAGMAPKHQDLRVKESNWRFACNDMSSLVLCFPGVNEPTILSRLSAEQMNSRCGVQK